MADRRTEIERARRVSDALTEADQERLALYIADLMASAGLTLRADRQKMAGGFGATLKAFLASYRATMVNSTMESRVLQAVGNEFPLY